MVLGGGRMGGQKSGLMYCLQLTAIQNDDWLDMNEQQNFNARNENFHINDYSKLLVGRNIISNRLTVLNNQVELDWLNLSLNSFKLRVKDLFLSIK